MLFYIRLVLTLLVNTLVIPVFLLFKCYLLPEWIYNKFIKYIIVFNGPVFIKYMQLLLIDKSSLREFISYELIKELTDLEDKVYGKTRLTDIININNKDLKDTFSIASGSIASVYEFRCRNRDYILKMTHKNIEQKIHIGITMLNILIYSLTLSKKYSKLKELVNIKNFAKIVLNQSNMSLESKNLKKFYKLYNNHKIINSPRYISHTNKIIIMTKLFGYKLNDFIRIYPNYKDETYYILISSIYLMIKEKYLHGDFHLGNILFSLKDDRVIINIFDFGIVFDLTDQQSNYLLNYIESLDGQYLIDFIKTINHNIPDNIEDRRKLYSKRILEMDIHLLYKLNIPLEIINLLSIFANINSVLSKKNINILLDFMIENNIID